MPETALVAGGAGFVGAHLVTALCARGWDVICLDNLVTGDLERLAPWLDSSRLTFVEADVRALPALPASRWVFNLACPGSPRHYQRDPVATLMTSVEGARQLLDYADACGARLLQASSSEVYGSSPEAAQEESHWGNVNPAGPRACYNEGKRCAETLCMDYRRTREASVRIARIFNTYGPGMARADGRVMSSLVYQALNGESLTLFGDGLQTRSFCYVDDLVEGLLALMVCDDEQLGPVNLGNPEEIPMLDLARRVLALTGSSSSVAHLPLPQDDPPRRRPSIARAREALGWSPGIPLEEGLMRYIESCRLSMTRADA